MQNHPIRGLLLAVLVLAGCSDKSSPTLSPSSGLHGGNSSISGQVTGLTFGPDSTPVTVPSRVLVIFAGSVPTDSLPFGQPDDPASIQRRGLAFLHDTTGSGFPPPPPPPSDTAGPPPPPPPPPLEGCGRPQDDVVADMMTDADGRFSISGLESAKYDLHVIPTDAGAFGDSWYCGVHLLQGQNVEVQLWVPTTRLN
ncbi:MAG TPA: hypothetical protein VH438_14995 [Gemmatimonadales bacterium]